MEGDTRQFPWTVTVVCREWKDIVFIAVILWLEIHVDVSSKSSICRALLVLECACRTVLVSLATPPEIMSIQVDLDE